MTTILKTLGLSLLASHLSCSLFSGLGPEPNISLVSTEISKTKKVKNVLIADPIGIDTEGSDLAAFLGGAAATYAPPRGLPMTVLKKALDPVGLPEAVSSVILASYQVEFKKIIADYKDKKAKDAKAKTPEKMPLPKGSKGEPIPKNIKDAIELKTKMAPLTAGAEELASTLTSGDAAAARASLDKNQELMGHVNNLAKWLIKKNKITYILLSQLDGSKEDYEGGKPVQLTVALVNVKSGALRYFATVNTNKKDGLGLPWEAQLASLSGSLFIGVDEKAPLPGH